MARANKNGWDFIKVGKVYQYKEDYLIARVLIQEDNSDKDNYSFKVKILDANIEQIGSYIPSRFTVGADKHSTGYYSGMSQFFENEEYIYKKHIWI